MALYLVSYDITGEDDEEYEPLYEKLEELGAERILESVWAVVDKVGRAEAIYQALETLTNEDAHLLVQELTKDARWNNLLISDDDFKGLLKKARG